jgi:CxxC motif-containing protein
VLSVSHNECKRGEVYAEKELVEPVRTLTTTIAVQGGSEVLLPVKTDGEIPKALLFQSMEILKRIRVKAPIKMGDLVFADILGTGVDVVACKNI